MGSTHFSGEKEGCIYPTMRRFPPYQCSLMPRTENLIDKLGKAQYITTLDLTKGYWQVPVAKADQHKMSFATSFGMYQFRQMPFTLQVTPATCHIPTDDEGTEHYVSTYLDDLIIFSEGWEEYLTHVSTVLSRLREAELIVKPQKCQFGMKERGYLGHVVRRGRVHVEAAKVEAIKTMEPPKT